MKRLGIFCTFVVALSVVASSCAIVRPLDIPFGQWENTEIGIFVDICPDICTPSPEWRGQDVCRFPGTYLRDGELIEIRIAFQDTPGGVQFSIYRYPAVIGQPLEIFYIGAHSVREDRLYLGRGERAVVLERIMEY